jgi:AraC-like DNA-binding protein
MLIKYLLPKILAKDSTVSKKVPPHLEHLCLPFTPSMINYESGEWGDILSQEISFAGQVYIERYYSPVINIEVEMYAEQAVIVLQGMILGTIKLQHEDGTLILLSKRRSLHYLPAGKKLTLMLVAGKKYRTISIIPRLKMIGQLQPDYPILQQFLDAVENNDTRIITLASAPLKTEDRNGLIRPGKGLLSQKAQLLFYSNRVTEFLTDYLEDTGDDAMHPDRLDYQINRLIKRLELHPEEPINVKLIAAELNTSQRNLEYSFKELRQCSLMSFVMKLRVENAKKLLVTTNKAIGEIAILVGYEDQSYFVKLFKKATGCSPTMFRLTQHDE